LKGARTESAAGRRPRLHRARAAAIPASNRSPCRVPESPPRSSAAGARKPQRWQFNASAVGAERRPAIRAAGVGFGQRSFHSACRGVVRRRKSHGEKQPPSFFIATRATDATPPQASSDMLIFPCAEDHYQPPQKILLFIVRVRVGSKVATTRHGHCSSSLSFVAPCCRAMPRCTKPNIGFALFFR
jgi:hypothetical protein